MLINSLVFYESVEIFLFFKHSEKTQENVLCSPNAQFTIVNLFVMLT